MDFGDRKALTSTFHFDEGFSSLLILLHHYSVLQESEQVAKYVCILNPSVNSITHCIYFSECDPLEVEAH